MISAVVLCTIEGNTTFSLPCTALLTSWMCIYGQKLHWKTNYTRPLSESIFISFGYLTNHISEKHITFLNNINSQCIINEHAHRLVESSNLYNYQDMKLEKLMNSYTLWCVSMYLCLVSMSYSLYCISTINFEAMHFKTIQTAGSILSWKCDTL